MSGGTEERPGWVYCLHEVRFPDPPGSVSTRKKYLLVLGLLPET